MVVLNIIHHYFTAYAKKKYVLHWPFTIDKEKL